MLTYYDSNGKKFTVNIDPVTLNVEVNGVEASMEVFCTFVKYVVAGPDLIEGDSRKELREWFSKLMIFPGLNGGRMKYGYKK